MEAGEGVGCRQGSCVVGSGFLEMLCKGCEVGQRMRSIGRLDLFIETVGPVGCQVELQAHTWEVFALDAEGFLAAAHVSYHQ